MCDQNWNRFRRLGNGAARWVWCRDGRNGQFFIARKVAGRWIYRFGTDTGQAAVWRARLAVYPASNGAQIASPQSLSSAEARGVSMPTEGVCKKKSDVTRRIPILIARAFPVLIAPRHSNPKVVPWERKSPHADQLECQPDNGREKSGDRVGFSFPKWM